jgi:mitogen-activated protein kinase kinase kinase
MDATHLKDMGIQKMGHRLRISTEVKILRNKHYKKASLQRTNRVRLSYAHPICIYAYLFAKESLALLDTTLYTPPSSASSRGVLSARSARSDKRVSRLFIQGVPTVPLVEHQPPLQTRPRQHASTAT